MGFINILLLILPKHDAFCKPEFLLIAAAIAELLGILVGIACRMGGIFPEHLSIVKTVGAALVVAAGFYVILRRHENCFFAGSLLIVLVSGVLVNPNPPGSNLSSAGFFNKRDQNN
ncbi:MAG: hypothetical protein ACLVHV_15630 [Oscillospiraceae bacterium]